jgi:hypothetical protein
VPSSIVRVVEVEVSAVGVYKSGREPDSKRGVSGGDNKRKGALEHQSERNGFPRPRRWWAVYMTL